MRNGLFAILFIVCCPILIAQQTMNNDEVIKLVKAGLSENLIVFTINSQPGKFDVSAKGLEALRAAGASDRILSAIVAKAPPVPTGKATIYLYRRGGAGRAKGYPLIFVNRDFLGELRNATFARFKASEGKVVLAATNQEFDDEDIWIAPGFLSRVYFPFGRLMFGPGCAGLDWRRLGNAQSVDIGRCEVELRDANAAMDQFAASLPVRQIISPMPHGFEIRGEACPDCYLAEHPDLKILC